MSPLFTIAWRISIKPYVILYDRARRIVDALMCFSVSTAIL